MPSIGFWRALESDNTVRGDSNLTDPMVTQTTVRGLFVGWIRLMYKGVNQTLDRGDSNDSPDVTQYDSPRWLKRQSEVELITTVSRWLQTTVRGFVVGWIRLMYKGVNQTLDRGDF